MKKNICIELIISALCLSSCTPQQQQRFTIVNNSDEEIMVKRDGRSILRDSIIIHPDKTPKDEYKEILWDTRIKPHSSRDIEYWGNWMYDYPDTTFFGIFNTIDLDTMSLEEFKTKYPIRYEFKVTLQDMIDRDWTLIYPPSE